jgi:hypothetical protein
MFDKNFLLGIQTQIGGGGGKILLGDKTGVWYGHVTDNYFCSVLKFGFHLEPIVYAHIFGHNL